MTRSATAVRLGIGAVAAALVVTTAAAPADAVRSTIYTKAATVPFLEMGPMTGAPGNAHYGYLTFYDQSDGGANVLGYIFHFDCPTGFTVDPTDDFDAAAAQMEAGCSFYTDGTESLEIADVQIHMTGGQDWSRVTGSFTSSLPTQPSVSFNLRFRGSGPIVETTRVERGSTYKNLYRDRTRSATARGTIGDLSIGDPGDLVFAGSTGRNRFVQFTW
ncbi:MAG TPA: hypothetical protein VLK34_00850 [Nocardioidaceae bacterium]|nr:hypothetical protein [Nocardioidaceae bacterium]